MYVLFIDFKLAYNEIKRSDLFRALEDLGIKNKLIRLRKMTLNESTNKIIVNGKLTEKIRIRGWSRQGDPYHLIEHLIMRLEKPN